MVDGWPKGIGVMETTFGLDGNIISLFLHIETSCLDLELQYLIYGFIKIINREICVTVEIDWAIRERRNNPAY